MGTYLNKTPGSEGNRKTWTFSTWIKRSSISTGGIFTAGGSGQDQTNITFSSSGGNDRIDWQIYSQSSGSTVGRLVTTQQFRDTAAWYHLICRYDSTQGTAGDRMRMYLNGSEITAFSTDTNPSQNFDAMINNTVVHDIGRTSYNNSNFFNGYLAETILADGQSYAPTSFGETDSTTGIWKPKTFSGSYGTNGFKLAYQNASNLGADTSGQSNNFTASNFATSNQVVDTPTNNFATWNPLVNRSFQYPMTLSQGNLEVIADSNTSYGSTMAATMSLGKGKWYWEFKYTTSGTGGYVVGWGEDTYNFNYQADAYPYKSTLGGSSGVFYRADGGKAVNSVESSGAGDAWAQNDIIGVAADFDASTITFYNQGVSQFTVTSAFTSTVNYYPEFYGYGSKGGQANFGNPSFSISSGNADANGYGNFEYAVPSGYYALCTENLNTYG